MLGRRSLKELVIPYHETIKRVLIVTEVALPSNTGSNFTLQTNDELLDKLRHHSPFTVRITPPPEAVQCPNASFLVIVRAAL